MGFLSVLQQKNNKTDLNNFYKEAKKRFDNEDEFKERSRLMVPKLQGGDIKARAGWKALYKV